MLSTKNQGGQLYMFGGESEKSGKLYHLNDLWVYSINKYSWEKINVKNGPSPRSGHRMTLFRDNMIVLFGGFFNNYKQCVYYNDLYIFYIESKIWSKIENEIGMIPSPRSAFHFVPYKMLDEHKNVKTDGLLMFWGYCVNETLTKADFLKSPQIIDNSSQKKNKKAIFETNLGNYLVDMYTLNPETINNDGGPLNIAPQIWRWDKVRQKLGTGVNPNLPARCGAVALSYNGERILLFGGVYDQEQTEEMILGSIFYNDTYQFDVATGIWVPFPILKCHLNDTTPTIQSNDDTTSETPRSLLNQIKKVKIFNDLDNTGLDDTNGPVNKPENANESVDKSPEKGKILITNENMHCVRPYPRMKPSAALLRIPPPTTEKGDEADDNDSYSLFLYGGLVEENVDDIIKPPELSEGFEDGSSRKNSKKYRKKDMTIILDDFYRLDLNPNKLTERCWIQLHPGTLNERLKDITMCVAEEETDEDDNDESDITDDNDSEITDDNYSDKSPTETA